MKTSISAFAIAITAISAFAFKPTVNEVKNYTVNTTKTTTSWLATKVTGQHNGNLTISKGTVNYNGKTITGGTIEFDMKSITCADLKEKEWNDKLIGHLKSDDFFSVDKHPTSTFVITKVQLKSGENYDVTGKLTIKGITNEITFPAVIKINEKEIITVAKITVNRTKFDIKYGSASFFESIGDKAINDNFELEVHVIAEAATN